MQVLRNSVRIISSQVYAHLVTRRTAKLFSISVSNCSSSSSKTTKFPQQSTTGGGDSLQISEKDYLKIAESTLDNIAEQFEALADEFDVPDEFDVLFTGDVLTVRMGAGLGTYVVNTQRPNRQIWLSSPVSGPKRYDWDNSRRRWIYRHDNSELGELLTKELSSTFKADIKLDASTKGMDDET